MTSYTPPKTWQPLEVVTASDMNKYLRDNFMALTGAKFLVAEDDDSDFLPNKVTMGTIFASPPEIGNVAQSPAHFTRVTINGPAMGDRIVAFATENTPRFTINLDYAAESGSNAGSDLVINRYSDGGSYLGTPFRIYRNNGNIELSATNFIFKTPVGGSGNFLLLDAAADVGKHIGFRSDGSTRWVLLSVAGGESGGSTGAGGSDFAINAYRNDGVYLGTPIYIVRSNLEVRTQRLKVDGAPATTRWLLFGTNTLNRWAIGANTAVESGSNLGSDLQIIRFNDDGSILDAPIAISRQSGTVYFNRDVVLARDASSVPTLMLSTSHSSAGGRIVWQEPVDTPGAPDTQIIVDRASYLQMRMYRNDVNSNAGLFYWMNYGVPSGGGGWFIGINVVPSYHLHLGFDSAAKPGTSTWAVVSDERTKKEIARFERGLQFLRNLPDPLQARYNGAYRTPEDELVVGWNAQDVLVFAPEWIRSMDYKETEDGKAETILSYTTHDLIFVLVNAVRELADQVEELQQFEPNCLLRMPPKNPYKRPKKLPKPPRPKGVAR